ncbi:MAG TPA: metallophosphoesterase [Myxococcota bacterium]|nr:metallophosphoesterase [Myxococcota bacterium]
MKNLSLLAATLLFVACGDSDLDGYQNGENILQASANASDTEALEPNNDEARFDYIAVLSDTHIVLEDDDHAKNLRAIGETLAQIPLPIKGAFIGGDIVFNLPYHTIEEYHSDPNDRFDIAQAILDDFPVPYYVAIGNHDMAIDLGVPRLMTEQLFMEHFGAAPYYTVDLGIWKFIILNNFHGPTMDPNHVDYDVQTGSLGEEQRKWLRRQLNDGRPAILMSHFAPFIINDISDIFEEYRENIRLFLAGHTHGWVNMSNHFGVPSMIIGSSQFDADSFMIMELDNKLGTWRVIDWHRLYWGSSHAKPWDDSWLPDQD